MGGGVRPEGALPAAGASAAGASAAARAPLRALGARGGGCWHAKALFALGKGQTSGLRDSGLRARLIECLGGAGAATAHPALAASTPGQQSSADELAEERAAVEALIAGDDVELPLDTTMVAAALDDGTFALISPAPLTPELLAAVASLHGDGLAGVSALVAPNLQHWTFVSEWSRALPAATRVLWAPPALGEDLAAKLPQLAARAEVLADGATQLPGLEARLLSGAPLNLNEVAFYHARSRSLVLSDGFYGGYRHDGVRPTWFVRLWFKLTKGFDLASHALPVYRSERVVSDGDPAAALACIDSMLADWPFECIAYAHGSAPYHEGCREALREAWAAVAQQAGNAATSAGSCAVGSRGAAGAAAPAGARCCHAAARAS